MNERINETELAVLVNAYRYTLTASSEPIARVVEYLKAERAECDRRDLRNIELEAEVKRLETELQTLMNAQRTLADTQEQSDE